ncbi:outer membrane beta-barrel protein [Rhizobium sp. WL3]|uniref:outer membrane beta-barrel protein n=1 Tax=Rhizobium sp. WL3 TaxID=2603277 RepID=UPI0011C207C2|nr:outer membrane beta-barrel protein [Rhizobium sp. WL3]QEE44840.1 outer membrane beta-barrel protein [Rhizobium sp. WL3]
MTSVENRDKSGKGRLGLRAFAGVLALSVFVHPSLLAAQQAEPGSATSEGTPPTWSPLSGSGQTSTGATGVNGISASMQMGATSSSQTATDPLATGTTVAPDTQALEPLTDADTIPIDEDIGRQNLREARVDNPTAERISRELDSEDDSGIRLGTLILRPSISQKLGSETEKSGGVKDDRIFSETGLKGTLTSDWSRHELSVGAEGAWQETLSGDETDKPRADIDARLRLDLADDTIATITGSYSFGREDSDDPNAVTGAKVQSGVHQYGAGASIERDFGLIRGSIGADVTRLQYSDAELSNGSTLERSDRNRNRYAITSRLGYELSPALIPFIEGTIGRIDYDDAVDSAGYRRSADLYGAKTGVAVDLGEKLRGEIAVGYERQKFEDGRLDELSALTVDGNIFWSPREGTSIDVTLDTSIDPSTTAGVNGATIHRVTAQLAHDLRTNLVARLTGGTTFTRYDGDAAAADTTASLAGAGLTWKVNRYLDATADLTYERTHYNTGVDNDSLTALVGLTAKR